MRNLRICTSKAEDQYKENIKFVLKKINQDMGMEKTMSLAGNNICHKYFIPSQFKYNAISIRLLKVSMFKSQLKCLLLRELFFRLLY